MGSKASAALLRLREIDKKYKHRQEDKHLVDSDSSISYDKKNSQASQGFLRPQLNIKIPDAYEECIETNSSVDNDEEAISVRIISDLEKAGPSSSEDTQERIVESINNSNNKILLKDINNGDEISISENLEDTNQSISESLLQTENENNDSSLVMSVVESAATTDKNKSSYVEKIRSSTTTSSAKYSDDSFEINTTEDKTTSQVTISSLSLKSEPDKQRQVIIESHKEIPNVFINDESLPNTLDMTMSKTLLPEDNKYNTDNKISVDEITINKNLPNSSSASIDENKTDNKSSNKTLSQDTVAINVSIKTRQKGREKHLKLKDSTPKVHTNNKEKITEREKIKNIKSIKSHNSLPTNKRNNKLNRKYLEQKIKKEHHYLRRDQERIHSTMIRYLRQIEEDRQRLILWPTRLICPERAEIISHVKPLEFPKVAGFMRSGKYKKQQKLLDFKYEL